MQTLNSRSSLRAEFARPLISDIRIDPSVRILMLDNDIYLISMTCSQSKLRGQPTVIRTLFVP